MDDGDIAEYDGEMYDDFGADDNGDPEQYAQVDDEENGFDAARAAFLAENPQEEEGNLEAIVEPDLDIGELTEDLVEDVVVDKTNTCAVGRHAPRLVPKNERKTSHIITEYERTRLVGMRANQIANGSQPTVDYGNLIDPLKIADLEFRLKRLPLIIKRNLPNGTYEEWTVDEMIYLKR